MEQLNGLDSLFVLSEFDHAPLHIGAVMVYALNPAKKNAFSLANMKTLLLDVIENTLPVLKSKVDINRLSLDKPYWVEDKCFNIENHYKHLQVNTSSAWPELHQLSAEFHAIPLANDKPLWEVLVVEGLEGIKGAPHGSTAILLKIHHALADGKTAVKLFSALHALSPELDAPLMARGLEGEPDFTAPYWFQKYSRAYWHTVSSPLKVVKEITLLANKLIKTRAEKSVLPLPTPPRTIFNSMPEADRVIGHISLPFTELSQITADSPYTINDIAICVIAGAMREYLSSFETLADAELQTLIPIDIRTADDDNIIGNQLSFAKMKLFSEIVNGQERLQAVHEATRQIKKEHIRMGPKTLLNLANTMYPSLLSGVVNLAIKGGLAEKIPPVTNTIISNVPGVPVPCYLCGAKLIDYLALGFLVPSVTLFHAISSVYSHVNISFLSCANSLPDGQLYQKALQDSYQALLEDMVD